MPASPSRDPLALSGHTYYTAGDEIRAYLIYAVGSLRPRPCHKDAARWLRKARSLMHASPLGDSQSFLTLWREARAFYGV